ncbi:hypothetical protein SCHPADRAFT_715953 [Schizopora paradoxa]|uniref:Uncharacterized protein n=1 Tax=Schizopora paradoxa TaxID=27342 RepID=A0A0H2R1P9_9AGAM|nr:hypothetical protein SCHPADRAFT_715953 [Schizopora paradoxa]
MLSEFDGIEILDDCDVPKDRELRMQEAFDRSKRSYHSEQIFTEIGHFRSLNLPTASASGTDPRSHGEEPLANASESCDRASFPDSSNEHDPIALRLRNLEYRLNDLYLRGQFQEALDLGLAELAREEASSDGKDGREQQILDLIMRCAIRLKNHETAVRLADKNVQKYPNIPGLLATASEAYLFSGESRKALSPVLRAISIRGPLPPFLRLLCETLLSMKESAHTIGLRNEATTALAELAGFVKAVLQSRPTVSRLGVGKPSNPMNATVPDAVPESIVREKASICGLSEFEEQGLVDLLCRGSATTVEDIRSVRGL